ncbi:L,D-transpeptidase (plasmid) [Rhizobium johnstonii]|nr:L,D-transpeptidase [Rhizobium johnstonii]
MISRRNLLLASPFVLAGCVTQQPKKVAAPVVDPQYSQMYGTLTNEPFPVAAVDLKRVKPQFLRKEIGYPTTEHAGTIVVDPNARYAYLVMENGLAIRYGVGVGKQEGFNFRGEARVLRKAEWPRWTPTQDMIKRDPERYTKYAGGLEGGPLNPLGPRALYLYADGEDTLYRLHGTVEPWTIGTMVSSGCIRFLNQDIIDLYRRVPVGTKVIVLPATPSTAIGAQQAAI